MLADELLGRERRSEVGIMAMNQRHDVAPASGGQSVVAGLTPLS